MSKNHQIVVRSQDIDPEFAEVYSKADSMPRKLDKAPTPIAPPGEEEDALLALKRIAEENQREYIDRKELKNGSFDQIEHDLSNTGRVIWNFLTR